MSPDLRAASIVAPPDETLQDFAQIRRYLKNGRTPWRRLSEKRRGRLINETIVTREAAGEANGKPFPLHDNYFVQNSEFNYYIYKRFEREIAYAATQKLKSERPADSAYRLLSFAHVFFLTLSLLILTFTFYASPIATLITLNAAITLFFLAAIFFRVYLIILSRNEPVRSDSPIVIDDDALPIISILLPLYRDAQSLPTLIQAIDNLDYPESKKDVKLLLEDDDIDTITEARRLGLHDRYQFVITPHNTPKTKPKACNYGLYLARGDLIVIYDAEDLPEREQLKKAAAAFNGADGQLACVQARLNYYNANDNWLTRLFTLEYSLWFDWLLPALQRMDAPIPLGGTSNFFRTDILENVGGWDPFNVTEDADLGLRLSRLGYRVEVLDSTTYEEANCQVNNWIRQRSRWMKGYLQTWLVHMRKPHRIIETTGWKGFFAVQMFVAGNLFSALINPVMWALFLMWIFVKAPLIEQMFPSPLMQINLAALAFGNIFFIAMMALAPIKRNRSDLSMYGLLTPVYWLLTSVAAYKGMWQAITKPHYWEKTDHVISDAAKARRTKALNDHF